MILSIAMGLIRKGFAACYIEYEKCVQMYSVNGHSKTMHHYYYDRFRFKKSDYIICVSINV